MNKLSGFYDSIPVIHIDDYSYELPAERVVEFPLEQRDASKLLVAQVQELGNSSECVILHKHFSGITSLLPANVMLVLNNTKVLTARIQALKPTGGKAELLCLHPIPTTSGGNSPIDPMPALAAHGKSRWLCMVGGRNLHSGLTVSVAASNIKLDAIILERFGNEAIVEFQWSPSELSFIECLTRCGHVPLPPYLKREDNNDDKHRYQTVFARVDGSVAAPTAGLHFTEPLLDELRKKGLMLQNVTLHVGAGTFLPVSSALAHEHEMHKEFISVTREMIAVLAEQLRRRDDGKGHHVVAVGTTSARTLETLYWFGVRLIFHDGNARKSTTVELEQWDDYRLRHYALERSVALPPPAIAIRSVLDWMLEKQLFTLTGQTRIFIVPGYRFMVVDALITNFHQPRSTLMLLVAAFLSDSQGISHWKTVYEAALTNSYRFLSYGDTSLLIRYKS